MTATAVAGSVATRETRSAWYAALDKPSFQPPAVVFPIAWTALYAAIAGSAAAVDAALTDEAHHTERIGADDAARELWRRRRRFRLALAANLALNAGWCWTFFAAKRLPAGTAVAAALAASSIGLARRAGAERPAAGAALVLYALWTGFATALTAAIWRRNPDA